MVPVHNLNSSFFFLIYMPGNRNMDLKLNGIFLPHHMAKACGGWYWGHGEKSSLEVC